MILQFISGDDGEICAIVCFDDGTLTQQSLPFIKVIDPDIVYDLRQPAEMPYETGIDLPQVLSQFRQANEKAKSLSEIQKFKRDREAFLRQREAERGVSYNQLPDPSSDDGGSTEGESK